MFDDKIVIIDYSAFDNSSLISTLRELNADFEVSKTESVICRSKKIIMPDTDDIKSSIRKLQLLNMFSMLKMVDKPILGINAGLYILCESICDIQAKGLSFFPLQADRSEDEEGSWKSISIINDTKLLSGIVEPYSFYFKQKYTTPVMELTRALFTFEGNEYSAVIENKNVFGTVFSPELSGDNGLQVLRNFISL